MTAIAGFVAFVPGREAAQPCQALLVAQRDLGPDGIDHAGEGRAHFGRALVRRFAEDRHDRQPVRGGRGRLLVADVRLDNRFELCGRLGIAPAEARGLADSSLLLLGWERWGDSLFDQLAGSYAVALWDSDRCRLVLARDPFGQCPLHFAAGPGWLAFASMPQALRVLDGVDGAPDLDSLAGFVADLPRTGRASYFRGIERIEPGHALAVTPAGTSYWRHWTAPPPSCRLDRGLDLVEAYRFHLDQAVVSCLRGAGETVAAHLSGGWDSAAVAATAAMQMAPSGRVIGFTAAPPADFAGPAPAGRISDESDRAALAAAPFANLEHRVVRDRNASPLDLLDCNNRYVGEPTGHVCNNLWWTAINAAAARESAILLTGEMGNHTLSAGGGMQLADLVRIGRFGRWASEARRLTQRRAMRWTGVLDQSFGPFLPFYGRLRPRLSGARRTVDPTALIAEPLRPALERRRRTQRYAGQPRNSRAHRVEMLAEQDSGAFRKAALARFGLDERDPTIERRLAEFCLALPAEALLNEGVARPLARAALADRLPREILEARERGVQFADWHRVIAPEDVAEALGGSDSASLLDRSVVDRLFAGWPKDGFERPGVVRTYRMDLMRAVSAAAFLKTYARSDKRVRPGQPAEAGVNPMEGTRPIPGREKQE